MGKKVREDVAPAPIDNNFHTALLEMDCNGQTETGFGQVSCSIVDGESIVGELTVHTPLPGSITILSERCGIDKKFYMPDSGGSFTFPLVDLFNNKESFCSFDIIAHWELPKGFVSEYPLRGYRGRMHIRQRPSKLAAAFINGKEGIYTDQLRAWPSAQIPLVETGYEIRTQHEIKSGFYVYVGCGVSVGPIPYVNGGFYLPKSEVLGDNIKKVGRCTVFGRLLIDGGDVEDFIIHYETYEQSTVRLAASLDISEGKACYSMEKSASVAVLQHGTTHVPKDKLNDCFNVEGLTDYKVGFFTNKGRACYFNVKGDSVEYLN